MALQKICPVSEIPPGGRTAAVINDVPILVLRVGENFYCVEDVCSHDGQPLTDGPLRGTELECPRHGARFDVTDGRAVCMPAFESIPTYDVEVRDGEVFVNVE